MRLVICNKSEMIINSLFCWSVVFMNCHSSVVRSLLNSLEKRSAKQRWWSSKAWNTVWFFAAILELGQMTEVYRSRKSWVNNCWLQLSHPEYKKSAKMHEDRVEQFSYPSFISAVWQYLHEQKLCHATNFFFHVELNYKRWEEDETFQFFGLVSASRIGNNCIHDFKIQKETPKMMQVATATQSLKITKKCLT